MASQQSIILNFVSFWTKSDRLKPEYLSSQNMQKNAIIHSLSKTKIIFEILTVYNFIHCHYTCSIDRKYRVSVCETVCVCISTITQKINNLGP